MGLRAKNRPNLTVHRWTSEDEVVGIWYTINTNLKNPVLYYDHRYLVWCLLVNLKIVFMDWEDQLDRLDISL